MIILEFISRPENCTLFSNYYDSHGKTSSHRVNCFARAPHETWTTGLPQRFGRKFCCGSHMKEIDPTYNDEQFRKFCSRYQRKAAVMKEICDRRHDKSLNRAVLRDFMTVTASALFLGLTFFGSKEIAALLGISDSSATVLMSVATFLLLATSIWQLSADRMTAFQNYRGIQEFAAIANKIEYVTSGSALDDNAATYWAKEITQMYDNAARDISRITDKEHAAAKKRLE